MLDLSLNRLRRVPNTSFSGNIISLNVAGNMLTDISGLASCINLQVQ